MGQKRRGVILVDTGLKINKLENKNTKYVVNKFTRTITSQKQQTTNKHQQKKKKHRSEEKKTSNHPGGPHSIYYIFATERLEKERD